MPVLNLADVLAHHGALTSDAICLVHEGERWSWWRLDARAEAWAARLREAGVESDDLVAFALPNGPEFLALAFGIYKAGATPAPLSPKLSAREMREILDIMRPAAVVADHPGVDHPTPAPDATTVTTRVAGRPAASWKACTSGGSTGRPKVIVDHRPASFDVDAGFIDLPQGDVVLVPGPLYHNAPFSAAVLGLARGNRLVTSARFDPAATLQLIERERAVWTMLVPTMMHRIWRLPSVERDARDLASLRIVVHTAAPMPAWLKAAWIGWLGADRIWEVYGATEGIVRTWIGGREWLERPGSVGRPIGGARLKILDSDGRELPAGERGEVYAMPPNGPASTYHYIGAARRACNDGWESVGDIGHVDADGYLYLADRRGDLIISGGVNIFPAEVEAALLEHPQVQSCAVIGLPDEDLGQAVHAVIQASAPLSIDAVRDFLRDRLAPQKHPRSLECQADPVRDDAGKVRRSQLIADRAAPQTAAIA